MKDTTKYKATLVALKSTIKADTEAAKKGPYRITSADDRRCHLLAYAFLRGKTYHQVEPNPFYLRLGPNGHNESLTYEKNRLAKKEKNRLVKKVASFIPDDLGDGTTDKDTFSHVTMWLDVGHVTRDLIIANRAWIEATRDALIAVGIAKGAMQEWMEKVWRITRDRDHAKAKVAAGNMDVDRIARYEADLNYAKRKQKEAVMAWALALTNLMYAPATEVLKAKK